MASRSIDTSITGPASVQREVFDRHLNTCEPCSHNLCWEAQVLWRNVCVTAVKGSVAKGGA